MICDLLSGIPLPSGGELACLSNALAARLASWMVIAVSILSFGWILVGIVQVLIRKAKLEGHPLLRRTISAALVIGCSVLLALASSQPTSITSTDRPVGHIAVVIDVSESVTRDPKSFLAARGLLADLIEGLAKDVRRDGDLTNWTGSVIVFDANARVFADGRSLSELPETVRSVRAGPRIGREDSNGAAGLYMARERIVAAGGGGMVVVLSDGNWLTGDVAGELNLLKRANLPVHVVPVGSGSPGVGIVAANLAASTETNAPAIVRLVVLGDAASVGMRLSARRDNAEAPFIEKPLSAAKGAFPVRIEHRFSDRGLRYIEIALQGGRGVEQVRRLYTLVKAPPRVLAFGTARWADRLDPDKVRVIRGSMAKPPNPDLFDVIILDGVKPESFPSEYPRRLAEAVAGAGRSVFLINGPHDRPSGAMTTIGAWELTPLQQLLPVDMDPRTVIAEPPPREVAMIIDTSGSMIDWELTEAVMIGNRVLGTMRKIDRLKIIAFASGHLVVLPRTQMTAEGKQLAGQVLHSLKASGGSNPGTALDAISDMKGNNCAVFFLSDGEIKGVTQKPGCQTVVFEISGRNTVINRHLERLGQVIPVDRSGVRPRIKFLEPEIRKELWRKGRFIPLPLTNEPTLAPQIPTDGVAIAYPRPEAERLSVHPDAPPDPLVAFRKDKRGTVGVFLSDFSGAWVDRPAGLRAIQAYIDRLAGWTDMDRYRLQARDGTTGIELELLVLSGAGDAVPSRISASIVTEGGRMHQIRMKPVAGQGGRFRGTLLYPDGTDRATVRGILEIGEIGRGSLGRVQRIPVRLPTAGGAQNFVGGGEIWTYGINRSVLGLIAANTGGRYVESGTKLFWPRTDVRVDAKPLHAWFLGAASLLFIGGLFMGGVKT
jgi:hypothetical protein